MQTEETELDRVYNAVMHALEENVPAGAVVREVNKAMRAFHGLDMDKTDPRYITWRKRANENIKRNLLDAVDNFEQTNQSTMVPVRGPRLGESKRRRGAE